MTDKGRIAIYNGLGQPFEIREYPVPEPDPGDILIKISMANICGSDLHWWRGDIDLAGMGTPMPMAPGHEGTGKVVKLGDGVTTDSAGQPLSVGDRVVFRYFYPCGRCPACLSGNDAACPMSPLTIAGRAEDYPHFFGTFADYYYLRPNHVAIKVPDDLTDQMVAPVNCSLCQVLYGLEKVNFSFGETIVIQGAGGLGINATAVAKEMGAHKVIVIDGIKDRLELAKVFGADELIDMNECKSPEERAQRVRDLTGGWGADVVAELVGFPAVMSEGLNMVAPGGRYLEIGNVGLGATFEIDPAMLVYSSKSIVAVISYGRDTLKKALDFMSRTKDRYPFEKILSHTYSLEDINRAFEEQDKGLVSRSAIVP